MMPPFDNRIKGRHFAFMDYTGSPFHKITGWKILALLAVTAIYSTWFTTIGPYGQLAGLAPAIPLEEQIFYSGNEAVAALSELDAAGRKAKFLSLACDIPYMILLYLTLEAIIAFGIRRLALVKPIWSVLFFLPIAFLLADFSEDSFIALTLTTRSELFGSVAGVMTFVKFMTVTAAGLTALILGIAGLFVWFRQGRP